MEYIRDRNLGSHPIIPIYVSPTLGGNSAIDTLDIDLLK